MGDRVVLGWAPTQYREPLKLSKLSTPCSYETDFWNLLVTTPEFRGQGGGGTFLRLPELERERWDSLGVGERAEINPEFSLSLTEKGGKKFFREALQRI